MWPGFIGTLTGINETGLYLMENAGSTGPGSVVNGLHLVSVTQKYFLENVNSRDLNETVIEEIFNKHASDGHGACGPGSIFLFTTPNNIAYVYEGDRFGGRIRKSLSCYIAASNHFQFYGVENGKSELNFGKCVSDNSLSRYESGIKLLKSWENSSITDNGVDQMKILLQAACRDTTEHSIIFSSNSMEIEVVNANLFDTWKAPYGSWITFHFNDFFN